MAENAIKCQKSKRGTDQLTDRQTDRRTDIVPYRVALHATKNGGPMNQPTDRRTHPLIELLARD